MRILPVVRPLALPTTVSHIHTYMAKYVISPTMGKPLSPSSPFQQCSRNHTIPHHGMVRQRKVRAPVLTYPVHVQSSTEDRYLPTYLPSSYPYYTTQAQAQVNHAADCCKGIILHGAVEVEVEVEVETEVGTK